MHTNVDYTNRPDREAVLNWAQWLGFKRSHILAKLAVCDESMLKRWRRFDICCSFAGVSGYPVVAAFAHFNRITVAQLRAHPEMANADAADTAESETP